MRLGELMYSIPGEQSIVIVYDKEIKVRSYNTPVEYYNTVVIGVYTKPSNNYLYIVVDDEFE